MAAHKEKEDLIAIGAYQAGADPIVDEALAKDGAIKGYLRQRVDEPSSIAEADAGLLGLAAAPVPPEEAAALLGEFPDVPVEPVPAPAPGPVALPPLGLTL
jgi:flagellum-specific ATP synthase